MATVINQKIVGCAVVKPTDPPPPLPERPLTLEGKTYKVTCPLSEHALYVTINNRDGRPFEMFINSKAMEHFQWIVALTRVVSAVFRQCEDARFLVQELKSIFDPKGGYWRQGKYVPSLVAELGYVLEQHLGLEPAPVPVQTHDPAPQEKAKGVLCPQCQELGVILMDGCLTCTHCGYSKCG